MDKQTGYQVGQWLRWGKRYGEIRSTGHEKVCVYWPSGAVAMKWYNRMAFEEALRLKTFVIDEDMRKRRNRKRVA